MLGREGGEGGEGEYTVVRGFWYLLLKLLFLSNVKVNIDNRCLLPNKKQHTTFELLKREPTATSYDPELTIVEIC